jgi:hypothetical protein
MRFSLATALAILIVSAQLHAKGQRGAGAAGPPQTGQAGAPFDMTGYWTSIITQSWRLRMVVPPKGDYMGIPMLPSAKQVADAWDPARPVPADELCKGYGAAIIMSMPERLHITWQDTNTLRMDIDAGNQTRLFHFGEWKSPGGPPTWQGDSVGRWVAHRALAPPSSPQARSLEVSTTNMRPGYLRKNGVPYSAEAKLTEYYDVFQEPEGDVWMIVTTVVDDPVYLQNPLILTAQFKKQVDASGWDPAPCSAK